MKIWKKTACIALGAVMSVGMFAGCGEDAEAKRREQAQASAKKYVNTVSETLESVKSFNVSGKVTLSQKDEYFLDGTTTVDPEKTEESKMFFYLDVTLTQDGEDNVAMLMTAKSEEIELEVGETEIAYQSVVEIIVKDGYAYNRTYMISSDMTDADKEEAKGLWDKTEITLPEELSFLDAELVTSFINAKEIKELGAQVWEGAQEIIAEKFFNDEVANGKVSWEKDFASDISKVLAFIEGIDESEDTLGSVINQVLAEIDPTLTVESIITTVKSYKNKTIADVMTEIDNELAKKETSLQDIYNKIVNSEILAIILNEVGMPVEEQLAMKNFQVETIKKDYGTMTVGQLVNMVVEMLGETGGSDSVAPASDETNVDEPVEVDYFDEGIAMVEGILATTLAELEIEMPDCSTIAFNKFAVDTGLQLNAAGDGLETLYLSIDADVRTNHSVSIPKENEGGYTEILIGYQYSVLSADLSISSFSSTTATINAPAADKIQAEAE